MSKFAKAFVSVFLLAAFVFASAGSVFAAGERSISLIGAEWVPYKGVVFTFDVKGDFDSYRGTATIDYKDHPLYCVFRDDGVLSCTMDVGGAKYIGKMAQISLNGYSFSAPIRAGAFCYSVYDVDAFIVSGEKETRYIDEYEYEYWLWWMGQHCQKEAGQEGDFLSTGEYIWVYDPEFGFYEIEFVYSFSDWLLGEAYYRVIYWIN